MIERIAILYVNVLEPAGKVFLVIAVVAFILYGVNLIRGGESKGGVVGALVNGIVKVTVKTVQLVGVLLLKSLKMLLNTSRVIFATLRDFFKSEI